MLGNAAPTQFDLRFSLFGIPIRVHPLFWVCGAVGGWRPDDFNLTFVWIGCLFISILIHELGHALSALRFGWPPEIVLYVFGGYASYHPGRGHTTGKRVAILLAGPGAGFVLFGIVWGLEWVFRHYRLFPAGEGLKYLVYFFLQMKWVNLWWGLVNLLPVYPLDGGQISRELLTHWRYRDGLEISLKLSLVVGAAVAVFFFKQELRWPAILFAMLAVESLQNLQASRY